MKTYINKFTHPVYALMAPILVFAGVYGIVYACITFLLFIIQFTPIF